MSTNRWNAKRVVDDIRIEYPYLIDYALKNIEDWDNGIPPVLPRSSSRVMKFIISDIILPTINIKRPWNAFEIMGVQQNDWLSLNKKTYEWIKAQDNLEEVMAFNLL